MRCDSWFLTLEETLVGWGWFVVDGWGTSGMSWGMLGLWVGELGTDLLEVDGSYMDLSEDWMLGLDVWISWNFIGVRSDLWYKSLKIFPILCGRKGMAMIG